MVLGFDNTALIVAIAFAALVLKPQQLHQLGRQCGRTVGWAVGHLAILQKEITQSQGKSELAKIHKEVQESISTLNAIQHEIRRGTQIFPQRPTQSEKTPQPQTDHVPSATPEPLPVSAEAAGLSRKRQGGMMSGSEIVMQSILEEEIAKSAKAFMQSGTVDRDV